MYQNFWGAGHRGRLGTLIAMRDTVILRLNLFPNLHRGGCPNRPFSPNRPLCCGVTAIAFG